MTEVFSPRRSAALSPRHGDPLPGAHHIDGTRLARLWGAGPALKDVSRAFTTARCRRHAGAAVSASLSGVGSVRLPFVTGRYNLARLIALHVSRQRRRSLLKHDDR